MTHTTIANGATGLSVRNILNNELAELFARQADTAVVVADATALAAIPAEYKSAGKLVLQWDTKTLYQYDGVSAFAEAVVKLKSTENDYIDFDKAATVTMQEARMAWDATDGTVRIGMPGGNVSLQVGQEMHIRAKNVQGSQINNGSVVYLYGASGQRATVKLADADDHDTAIRTIGVATEDIGANQNGYITVFGLVNDINTDGMTEGAPVYLSGTAGDFVETRPTPPAIGVMVGYVVYAHLTQGKIFVHPSLFPYVSDLSDVIVSGSAEGDLLYWDDSAKVWKNRGPKFGNVGAGNYSEFEADGTLKFNGDATVWKDLIISANNLRPGSTPPTYAAFLGGIYAPRFDAGASQFVYGSFELQHDYKEGTNLDLHVHWTPTTTNTGNIVWGVEYSVANIGDTFPAPTTASMTPAAASGVVSRHVLSDIVSISGTGLKIGAIVAFRLFRQNGGTDTFTGNAFLHSVGAHYECDTTGSRQELVK